jgi:hypothetical protein
MVKSAINATGAAPIYAARAWVNFNGASGAIRSSGNISSVTRNSLGQYTITILDNMPDANYAVSGTSSGADAANDEMILYVAAGTMAAGSVRVRTSSGSGNANDESIVSVIIHR